MYLRLMTGEMIFIEEEMQKIGVSARTIKRDILEIRNKIAMLFKKIVLVYDKKKNGFQIIQIDETTNEFE